MSKSTDITIDGKYKVHLAIIPHLGLLIVNELEDFAENWVEIKAVENSRFKVQYEVNMLAGARDDGTLHASRFFVESIHTNLHKKMGQSLEQVGSLLKFILNIKLRTEILENRSYIMSIGNALGSLVSS